jgi:hypothetical protein
MNERFTVALADRHSTSLVVCRGGSACCRTSRVAAAADGDDVAGHPLYSLAADVHWGARIHDRVRWRLDGNLAALGDDDRRTVAAWTRAMSQ